MKKLMIIPALLLVAALFVTCDTGGDWLKIPFPLIPTSGAKIIYSNGWVGGFEAEHDGSLNTGSDNNLFYVFKDPVDAVGYSKLMVVYNSSADFSWWVGGTAKDVDAKNLMDTDYLQPLGFESKGFWILTFPLSNNPDGDKSKLSYFMISGGGGKANPGWGPENIVAIWLQ